MGKKRLELRNGWAWLVLGEENSRARTYIISAEHSGWFMFKQTDKWLSEFKVTIPRDSDVLPAAVYFNRLCHVIKTVEEYNDYENANALLYGEMDLVEIQDEVYALKDNLKKILEGCYERLRKRSIAVHEAIARANHIEDEYGKEIVWKDMPRRELLQELQYGRLMETAETKTLYEMYDDGYRWQK